MAEVFPNLWYKNALMGAPYTLNGGITEASGFEWANVSDWRDFTEFKWAPVSMSYIEMTLATTQSVSAFILWASVCNHSLYTLSAELGSPGGGFTDLADIHTGSTLPVPVTFAAVSVPSGNKIRITRVLIGGEPDINHFFRLAFAGSGMVPERGMFNGVQPPTLSGSIVSDTVISVNGSIIGRNTRRVDRQMRLDFSPVSAAWVRNNWEPFVSHMQKYGCFYQWNPVTYPLECAFGGAESIVPPENSNLKGFMKVSMPMRLLV